MKFWLLILFNLATFLTISAQQCGSQAGNALCANGLCCSQFGYCGSTPDYCSASNNCQSQCTGSTTPGTGTGLGSTITSALFDHMLRYRARCQSNGFYIYNAFINAAGGFSSFGTTGDYDTRKREVAAFLAQTSHETDKEMRGRSYSPSPPRGYSRIGRSPSPRDRSYSGSRGRDLPTSLLVLNLRYDFRPEDLRRPFGRFGPLKDVYLPRDYYSGRGFGFVQFVDPNDAAEAKYEMDGQILLGRQLTVVFAEENRKKPSDMRVRERRGGSGRSSDRRRSTCRYSRSLSYK